MDAFVWDQNFITGLADVDSQHQELVALFNQLNHTLFHGENTTDEQLEVVFQQLLAYAAHHFTDEEGLMVAQGLDARHVVFHQQVHQQFVDQVKGMWKLRGSLKQPGETLMGFLTSWLGLHILGIDHSMARQIASIEGGMAAADAFELEAAHNDNGMQALLKMVGNLYHVLAQQNADLVQANQHLEQRVSARTAELAHANTDLQVANEQLQAFSRTDGLLQIANRQFFNERLLEEVSRAQRQGKPLGLLMMDVDFFKRYNDTYGHQAGDACLQAVAQAARGALRRSTDFLARYGGEELVALLPDTDAAGARLIGQRVVDSVAGVALPHTASDAAAVVTLSVGVACEVPLGHNPDAAAKLLLAAADAALYAAKHAGRNRVGVAPPAGVPAD